MRDRKRHDPLDVDERPDLIDPPGYLDARGKKWFRAIVDQLQRYDLETKTNPILAGTLAQCLATLDRAYRQSNDEDLTLELVKPSSGEDDQNTELVQIKANPIFAVIANRESQALRLVKLLGLATNAEEAATAIGQLTAAAERFAQGDE